MKIIKQDLGVCVDNNDELNSLDWYKNYRLHREDGPAEEWNDGEEFYYLKGIHYHKDMYVYWKEVHENY